ncbi:unnamed protein product [Brassica rapa subsp. trilocularis]
MDPLRTTCFYFLCIVFVILSPSCLCDSRRLGPMEKKLGVNRDHLIAENNEEITKQGVPSTNVAKTLLSEAPIEHDVANHGQINGNSMKDGFRVKPISSDGIKTLHKQVCSMYICQSVKLEPRKQKIAHSYIFSNVPQLIYKGFKKQKLLLQKYLFMIIFNILEKKTYYYIVFYNYIFEVIFYAFCQKNQVSSLSYYIFLFLLYPIINMCLLGIFGYSEYVSGIMDIVFKFLTPWRVSETRIGQNRVIILRNQIKFVSFHIVRGSGSLHHL